MTRALTSRLTDQAKRIDPSAARLDNLERSVSAINHTIAELRATVAAFAGDNGYRRPGINDDRAPTLEPVNEHR